MQPPELFPASQPPAGGLEKCYSTAPLLSSPSPRPRQRHSLQRLPLRPLRRRLSLLLLLPLRRPARRRRLHAPLPGLLEAEPHAGLLLQAALLVHLRRQSGGRVGEQLQAWVGGRAGGPGW